MPRIEVEVGAMCFEFTSQSQWVEKAAGWYRHASLTSKNAICVDAASRICLSGKEFQRAEEEGTYPIRVYAVPESRRSNPAPTAFCGHGVSLDHLCTQCQSEGIATP